MTPQIQDYLDLDLSNSGAAAQELFSYAEQEARQAEIRVSGRFGRTPNNLTASMRNWFEAKVAPVRDPALNSVTDFLNSVDRTEHGDPVFLDRDTHRLDRDTEKQKRSAIEADRASNRADYERFEALRHDEQRAQRRFETLRARHGREPREWSKWLYLTLLMFVGLAELAINWESFNAIDYFTPAIATGTSLVIGLALACSSHFFGMTMRQFRALFDASMDDIDRYSGMKMLSLSAATLSIVLGAVYYSRLFYFQQEVMDSWGTGADVSMLKIIGGSMISNLLVWIVGVLIAYMAHDADPHFPTAKAHLDEVRGMRESLSKRIDKRLSRVHQQIDSKHKKELEALNNRANEMSNIAEQHRAAEMISRIKAQDGKVIALLASYRQKLLAPPEIVTVFVSDSDSDSDVDGAPKQMSPREYGQQSMEMYYV